MEYQCEALVYQLLHVLFSTNWISLHNTWHRYNTTTDLYLYRLNLTDRPLTNVQTLPKCTFLNIAKIMSCGGYRGLSSPQSSCVIYTVIWALFVLASISRCWSLSHTQGGSRPSPWEPSSSSEDSLSGTRAGSSWSSTLTLLDSIIPVLAWNLTVFNLARSFFSTLEGEKEIKGVQSWCWEWIGAVI